MTLAIDCVLIDCNDFQRMSEFWQSALTSNTSGQAPLAATSWLTNRGGSD